MSDLVLVTGATGFIGTHLVRALRDAGQPVRTAVRRSPPDGALASGVEAIVVGDLEGDCDWKAALRGVRSVVHLAGLAHVVQGRDADLEPRYLAVNATATRRLAESAASGVRRFVFLSSSKVLGEKTPPGLVWTEETTPAPQDAYGRSKLAAERALLEISRRTGMETVILRSPIVYGPGVGANIYMLFRLVDNGVPLPLASVHNRRSLVGVDNLVSAVELAMTAPGAAGEVFHVSDGEDLSTADLVRQIAGAMGRPARLVPFPVSLLRAAGRVGDLAQRVGLDVPVNTANVTRLVASLVLDSGKLRSRIGWRPPATLAEGLARTAHWYREAKGRSTPPGTTRGRA